MVEASPDVAVLGLSVRAAGAPDAEAFWEMISQGRIVLRPGARAADGRFESPPVVRRRAFDRHLFGLGRAEALILDPQVRALLELSWAACEDAMLASALEEGSSVGVYVGAGPEEYLQKHLLPNSGRLAGYSEQDLLFANSRDFLASRISHSLNLTGPSLTVQTACSTSLVAIHQAVRALLTYECDFALAGGMTVHVDDGFEHVEGGVLSQDGACRSFDRAASGAVPTSGGGMVVLCRVEDLRPDSLPRAVILGSAVNNDGADRQNFAAPSPRGQAAVIGEALAVAGVDASEVDFVESHGTGTRLGDQIELETLERVYGSPERPRRMALGALKVNLGHADAGAGVLGFAKAVLAVEAGVIPGTPRQAGDAGDILAPDSRLHLPRGTSDWGGARRVAAVSSFGLGGTNAHVILTDAGQAGPARSAAGDGVDPPDGARLVALSGADADAPARIADQLMRIASEEREAGLSSSVRAVQQGRSDLRWRSAVVATGSSDAELGDALERLRGMSAVDSRARGGRTGVALVLPGQGGDLAGVGRTLAQESTCFRECFDECALAIIAAGGSDVRRDLTDDTVGDPESVQPLVFALGVALGRTLERMGIRFTALIGHSLGEFAAAVLAGVMSLDVGATAVVRRARATREAAPGGMTAIAAPLALVEELAARFHLTTCAYNGAEAHVLGGPRDRLGSLEEELVSRAVRFTRLTATHAFHTASLQPAQEAVHQYLSGVPLRAPDVPVYSTVTGARLTDAEATSAQHWSDQIVRPIRFEGAVREALEHVELDALVVAFRAGLLGGPLHGIVRDSGREVAIREVLGRTADEEHRELLRTVGDLWALGHGTVTHVGDAREPRVRMPAYPFIDEEFWVEAASGAAADDDGPPVGDPLGGGADASPEGPGEVPRRSLRDIWLSVLDGGAAGSGNFFLDGGTSLHAAQLIAQVNSEFLVECRLSHLYESPGFDEFASVVERLVLARDEDAILALLDEIERTEGGA